MNYHTMSQHELAGELERLLAARDVIDYAEDNAGDADWALRELTLHKVELELQNRELRRTQQATEDARNRYRKLYDFAPVGYCSMTRDGVITELNLTAATIFRVQRADCLGLVLDELCPPLKSDAFLSHFASCLSRNAQVSSDIWVAIETRGWVPLEFRSEPAYERGEIIGFNTIITERKREEDARRLITEVRQLLVDSSPHRANIQGIAELIGSRFADVCVLESLDVLGALTTLAAHGSASSLQIVGEGRGDASLAITHGAPNVARTGDGEMETFRTGSAGMAPALSEHYCPLLRRLSASAYISVPLRAKTTLLGVMTLVMRETNRGFDERDLRVAQELASSIGWVLENARQLAETQRQIQLRQDLLALVAHDLRSPLNAVRVASELLIDATDEEHLPHPAIVVRRSVETMARMIEDLLDFSSVEAGRLSIQRERVSLHEMLRAGVDSLQPAASKKCVELVIDDGAPDVDVLCDRYRVLQVLSNLGENALKFPQHGRIRFGASLRSGEVEVYVHDSGPGIPPDLLPRIFDRYWRMRRDGRRSGRGLGLFIARGIVEGHDGRIWAESEPGRGARFCFTLPLPTGVQESVPTVAEAHPRRLTDGSTILIVDDDDESRTLLRTLLTKKHFRVHTASNGHEGIALAQLVQPQLVLLDLSMPMMDGSQFVSIIREDEQLRRVPIVLISGNVDLQSTAKQLRVAGAASKPIEVDSLLRTINAVLA